jgi:hypothetical protein
LNGAKLPRLGAVPFLYECQQQAIDLLLGESDDGTAFAGLKAMEVKCHQLIFRRV